MAKKPELSRQTCAVLLVLLLMLMYLNHRSAVFDARVYPFVVIAAPLFIPLFAAGVLDPQAALVFSPSFECLPTRSKFLGLMALIIGLCGVAQCSYFYLL